MVEILVLGEVTDGELAPSTGELLAAARELGEEVAVALVSNELDGVSDEAFARGAGVAYLVQDPLLAEESTELSVAAYEQVCRQTAPSVVLVGRTMAGRDIGPRLAFRLGVGLAQDCIEVKKDPETGRVEATRPVYGGTALATVTFLKEDPQVVVIRGGAYDVLPPDPSRAGEVIPISVDLDASQVKVRHVETVRRKSEGVRLEDAPVVVCGGRGLGGPEPFEALKELARMLGGAVGASRAVCDAGWLDYSYQVGLTGKTVSPGLYITVGISGASQHMAGCSGAKNIVAMNRDPEANIFKEAAYGVVGDWKNVLPAFIETVGELVGYATRPRHDGQ